MDFPVLQLLPYLSKIVYNTFIIKFISIDMARDRLIEITKISAKSFSFYPPNVILNHYILK